MLETIRGKIRALIEDFQKSGFEVFTYTTSNIFPLSACNIITITGVLKNGISLGSGEYSFNSTTNKLTVTASLSTNDTIEVDYTYYKYSDTEIDEYIRGALVHISQFARCSNTDYELEDDIYPTPDNKTTDLISLVASILIKPDYTVYRLPNLTVRYDKRMDKDDRIEKVVMRFLSGEGVNDIIQFNIEGV